MAKRRPHRLCRGPPFCQRNDNSHIFPKHIFPKPTLFRFTRGSDSARDSKLTPCSFPDSPLYELLYLTYSTCRGYYSFLWCVRGYCGKSSTDGQSFLEVAANCVISPLSTVYLLVQSAFLVLFLLFVYWFNLQVLAMWMSNVG